MRASAKAMLCSLESAIPPPMTSPTKSPPAVHAGVPRSRAEPGKVMPPRRPTKGSQAYFRIKPSASAFGTPDWNCMKIVEPTFGLGVLRARGVAGRASLSKRRTARPPRGSSVATSREINVRSSEVVMRTSSAPQMAVRAVSTRPESTTSPLHGSNARPSRTGDSVQKRPVFESIGRGRFLAAICSGARGASVPRATIGSDSLAAGIGAVFWHASRLVRTSPTDSESASGRIPLFRRSWARCMISVYIPARVHES